VHRRLTPTWLIPILLVMVVTGCSGADSGPVYVDDVVTPPTPAPTTQVVVPLTTVAGDES